MVQNKKVRVLIVDDSMIFREVISREISEDRGIEVVGIASDAFEARDKIIELEPDVMTLDVEMPKMSGIEFLRKLLPQYPLPVVVVSSVSERIFDALNVGAVDFVTKPDAKEHLDTKRFINELIVKIKIASMARVDYLKTIPESMSYKAINRKNDDVILAIGASTGGTEAILEVIKDFPTDMCGVVVVQHMPPVFTRMYADRLNNCCRMEVKEAADRDVIRKGRVLIAPGDFQMKVGKENGMFVVKVAKGEKVSGHCPSVDVLFESVAEKVGNRAIGVILTGMGSDGAIGLLNMRKMGAQTIGQDEKSSIVYGMPMVAFNVGAVKKQVSLNRIAQTVLEYLSKM